jgi:hypothetical protein
LVPRQRTSLLERPRSTLPPLPLPRGTEGSNPAPSSSQSVSAVNAERVEIGQSSGIEFGVDGPGELGLAGTIMSERQQSDGDAARLLFAVTGQQRFGLQQAAIMTKGVSHMMLRISFN